MCGVAQKLNYEKCTIQIFLKLLSIDIDSNDVEKYEKYTKAPYNSFWADFISIKPN